MVLKIAIASDHAGFEYKKLLQDTFRGSHEIEWLDLGTDTKESVDYPDFGRKLATAIENKLADFGVAICGSGVGISIAVNRNKHARCVLCNDETTARLARQHNDANVIAFGARLIGEETMRGCLKVFLDTKFEGGRHGGRVDKLSNC